MAEQSIIILTHRGLEPSNKNVYPESSFESFLDQIERGFGIEFDPNFCKDVIAVNHDSNLKRITDGLDSRNFFEVTEDEVKKIRYGKEKKGRIPLLDEILCLIENNKANLHAMHLKGKFQNKESVDLLLNAMKKYPDAIKKIVIFDIKPEIAKYIKSKNKEIKLAPSVAHEYDIKRYNSFVSGTLISVEDAIKYKKEGLYDWAWLDEWDTIDENGNEKKIYTKEVFDSLRNEGYKIALVTPELHGTSPGLLGGEAHKDAKNKEVLFDRIKEIISLNPDAVCTDYPEEVLEMTLKD